MSRKDEETAAEFPARHYYTGMFSVVENALKQLNMCAPLLTKAQLEPNTLQEMMAAASSGCIEYVRNSLNVKEPLYVAVSLADQNAAAIGKAKCIVLSTGYIISLINLISNLCQSHWFRDIWTPGKLTRSSLSPLTHQVVRAREDAISILL